MYLLKWMELLGKRRWGITAVILFAMALVNNVAYAEEDDGPVVQISDVDHFYRILDEAEGQPTAELLQRDYIDKGSEGLRTFAKLRNISGERIAAAIQKKPELYLEAKRCVKKLPKVQQRLRAVLEKLSNLYPESAFPPVTILIGAGRPVGIGGPETGVQIGLEALCATDFLNPNLEDRFVYVITHEFIHVQQNEDFVGRDNRTVLEVSLEEGVAEFVTELIAGEVAYSHLKPLIKGREEKIEKQFLKDKNKTDLSDWLYNTSKKDLSDLGYWVGYRIAKSYYEHAESKQQALQEILEIRDAESFLKKSAWKPGMQLD